jgi:hypothetical protein
VDRTRVWATGFSQGGSMTWWLACAAGRRFTASFPSRERSGNPCGGLRRRPGRPPPHPRPLGRDGADGRSGGGRPLPPGATCCAGWRVWRKVDGCAREPTGTEVADGLSCRIWAQCARAGSCGSASTRAGTSCGRSGCARRGPSSRRRRGAGALPESCAAIGVLRPATPLSPFPVAGSLVARPAGLRRTPSVRAGAHAHEAAGIPGPDGCGPRSRRPPRSGRCRRPSPASAAPPRCAAASGRRRASGRRGLEHAQEMEGLIPPLREIVEAEIVRAGRGCRPGPR